MKVVLLQDIKGTGKKNQIIEVSDGYARNFLFPRKLALEANNSNMNSVKRQQEAEAHREHKTREAAEDVANKLKGGVIRVTARAGENGRLYGSVTSQEVSDALKKQHGVNVDKRKLDLPEAIRSVGSSEVSVWLYPGVKTTMTVITEAE